MLVRTITKKVSIKIQHLLIFYTSLLSSCIVSHSNFMNDARELDPKDGILQFTAGTSATPIFEQLQRDSVAVIPSGKYNIIPVAGFNMQYQTSAKHKILGGIHAPLTLSCLGGRLGYQYTLFSNKTISWAVGGIVGAVWTKDAIRGIDIQRKINDFTHADIFSPFTWSLNENMAFTLTPRYSLARFEVRQFYDANEPSQSIRFEGKIISLGLHYKRLQIEGSYFFDAPLKMQIGMGWKLHFDEKSPESTH